MNKKGICFYSVWRPKLLLEYTQFHENLWSNVLTSGLHSPSFFLAKDLIKFKSFTVRKIDPVTWRSPSKYLTSPG